MIPSEQSMDFGSYRTYGEVGHIKDFDLFGMQTAIVGRNSNVVYACIQVVKRVVVI